jgi:hypothetical protein
MNKTTDILSSSPHPTSFMSNVVTAEKLEQVKTEPKNRCEVCNKKTGLLGFICKCGKNHCSSHRHAEAHGCSFDYKAEGQVKLTKNNPVIKTDKINKI